MNEITPSSDPIYKRLYSFPEMVEDLLRSLLSADTLGALDLRSLAKVPASYVGDDFRIRHGVAAVTATRCGGCGRLARTAAGRMCWCY